MSLTTNIYLDIDGVLLANENFVAPHAPEFLAYVLWHFPHSTYWLTTHCRGDASTPIEHVGHLFDEKTRALMKNIKATDWVTAKTEGIDFSVPFLWFDDDLFDDEKVELQKRGLEGNWIEVNLNKNVNALNSFLTSFPLPVNAV